jgi:Glycosyltransferase (GlcNAc)
MLAVFHGRPFGIYLFKFDSEQKRTSNMRIFVQLASYRDPQLIPTIEDMLRKAKYPQFLRIGICRQYHPRDGFDSLDRYRHDRRFKILNIDSSKSKGACWARHLAQGLYEGEEYTLQIDSHMRFAPNWDESLKGMMGHLVSKGFWKPLLTTYVPAFEPDEDFELDIAEPPLQMAFDHFSPEGIVLFKPEDIPNSKKIKSPIPARFFSGHFAFAFGKFCTEVLYDPDLYFHGEEISIAVRAFTCGYDLFHPHKTLLWHSYQRNRPTHWDDQKDWYVHNDLSLKKVRRLLGVDNEKADCNFDGYGLGTSRTLRDYERYACIDFSRRSSQR